MPKAKVKAKPRRAPRRILVTGGAGYIGSACAEYLLDRGYAVTVFDSLATGHRDAVDPRAKFVRGELADRELIHRVVRAGRFAGIMHFAAFSLVGESMRDPGKYFRNNVGAGLNLLDAAVAAGVPRFVFSSTCATYGEPTRVPIPETEKQAPISPYGESKLMFEKALAWYERVHGLRYVALRYFNAAGATARCGEDHRPETHLVPLVLQVALGKRQQVEIFGDDYPTPDGTCIRDYIHILDLAQAHLLALDAPRSGHYNLGTGAGASVKEIVAAARAVTGRPIPVKIASRRPGDPPRLIGACRLAKAELGWRPEHEDPSDILASAWQWLQRHPDGYRR